MNEQKKKSRADVEVEVRNRVDCEETAFRWVEHLALVDSISKEELSKMTSEIMLCHYNDINEERAISKVCGYPLCDTKLGKRSQHKYHISMKHNKVIDLTVRQNFCSLYCYQASKYIENQIPQVPIWLRDGKPLDINFLEREEKTSKEFGIGEVPLGVLPIDDGDEKDEKDGPSSDDDETDKISYRLNKAVINDKDIFRDSDDEIESKRFNVPGTRKKSNERKQTKLIDSKDIVKQVNNKTQQYITKINELLKEWLTKKSFKHLNVLTNEFYDSDDDDEINEENIFPDTADFQNRVMNFLSRQPEWVSESNVTQTKTEKKNDKGIKNKILPSVDSRSQNSIRRRIVHEKLNGSLREVLPICGLLEEDLTQVGFFKFVDTFNFTSKNIVLNIKEWTAMTIVLLKVIAKTYQKDFGSMKNRRNDINDFLVMRNLPNVLQIEEVIKSLSDNIKFGDVVAKTDIHRDDSNDCEGKLEGDGIKEDPTYYYDTMEEVD